MQIDVYMKVMISVPTYLDPDKKKSGKKVFYSEAMLSKLDNHYTRK